MMIAMSRIMGGWEVHVALLGVTIYMLKRIREKRRIDDLLASYGPDVKLPPHLISFVPYLVSNVCYMYALLFFDNK